MKLSEKHWFIIIGSICAVYVLLRFWHLTDSCLWFDEIFSVHAAEHSFQNLFWFVAQDLIHPPLFYVLLKFWILIGGENLFWLRSFPVLFSIISLIPFFFLCRQLKLTFPTIALALTFLTVSGSLIKYAQEVRMYSLLLCLSLFSMWLFARFLNVGKNIWFLTFVNVLLVYTQYFGWFVVLSEILLILYLQRIKIGQILIMFGITLLSFTPWIFAVWKASQINADFGQNLGWASKPDFLTLFQFLFNLFEPFYYQSSSVDASSVYLVSIPLLLIIITAFVFYLADWKTENDKEKSAFYFLSAFILIPILLAFTASWILPFSIWGTRHLIIIFAPLAILSAKILNKLKKHQLKSALLAGIFLLFGIAFLVQTRRETPQFIWCAWENLAQELPQTEKNAPTKIFVFEDLVAYHLWFALHNSDKNYQIVKVNNVEGLREDKAYFLPRGFDEVQTLEGNEVGTENFWIAFREKEFNELKPPLQNLIKKGCMFGEPKAFEAQGLTAFLLLVKNDNQNGNCLF
ncbi:MAG: hypothetical protein ABI891_14880 [Acidobacteriota bacterium]